MREQQVLLVAIAAAPLLDQLALKRWRIQANGYAEVRIEVLERDRLDMALVDTCRTANVGTRVPPYLTRAR
jgi:hypothetical protein